MGTLNTIKKRKDIKFNDKRPKGKAALKTKVPNGIGYKLIVNTDAPPKKSKREQEMNKFRKETQI